MSEEPESEEEPARYFDEHRGDVSLWEEKPAKIRVRRGGASVVFSVRFSKEELAQLQETAGRRGVTISELIRTAALASVGGHESEQFSASEAASYLRQVADYLTSLPRTTA